MSKHSAHSEWVLNLIVGIDEAHRGFAGDFLRASNERQQVIAAYLAINPPREEVLAEVGEFLSAANHREILLKAYGTVPEGHRGALRRAGPVIHDQRFYSLLHQLLAHPPHVEMSRTITRLSRLDRKKLLISRMLPQELCRPCVVEAVEDVSAANDVATAYELLVSLGVDETGLADAICQVRSANDLTRLWQRWVLKARCSVRHPVPSNEHYRPVDTAKQLQSLALKFRNCGARYTANLLQGSDAFALFEHEDKQAVVHLQNEGERWQLEGLYGPRNSRPSRGLRLAIEQYLAAHGVTVRHYEREKPSEWDSLRRVMRGDPFAEFEFE